MDHSDELSLVAAVHQDARQRRLFFQSHDGDSDGRTVVIDGRRLVWFGSCSYLGLEHEPSLVEGAVRAVRAHGTQFASSRGYVSLAGHAELEAALSEIFGGHALIGQTTTLAHLAAFDALLDQRDALVLDHQVHASVQTAAVLARARGTTVEVLRHERLAEAPERVAALARTHRRVWFATDGVTSMYGDLAPYLVLREILTTTPTARLYIDDAHGTGWAGQHGRGMFLERLPLDTRVVVATSLAKSFAAGGAALVFADPDEREAVRITGGTMVFSGPLQPALLGAALASAALHLGPDLPRRQRALWERTRRLKDGLVRIGLPLLADNDVPLAFVPIGTPAHAMDVVASLEKIGYYANVSMFPSVPQDRAGVRLTLTNHLSAADIDGVLAALAEVVPSRLRQAGISVAELQERFSPSRLGPTRAPRRAAAPTLDDGGLTVERHTSIQTVDREEWDTRLGSAGCVSWAAMQVAEACFSGPEPEHQWAFEYVIVRGRDGAPVAATVFVDLLAKDDFLDRAEVSAEVEQARALDPMFLVSRVRMAGGGLSEGPHVWLDRSGPWRAALHRLTQIAVEPVSDGRVERTILRDLPDDPEVAAALHEEGFVPAPMPDRFELTLPPGGDVDRFVEALPRRQRRLMRRRLDDHGRFVFERLKPSDKVDFSRIHELYLNVANRNLAMNLFRLPQRLLPAMVASSAWEVIVVHLPVEEGGPEDGRVIGWYAAHPFERTYAPLVCGLDYQYVTSHGLYRHLLVEMVRRASLGGFTSVRLGMSAEHEKRSVGALPQAARAWVHGRDTWNSTLLSQIAERLSLRR